MSNRARIRLSCPCGHAGSILVTRQESGGERYLVEGFFGELDVFLPGTPTPAQMLAAVRPACPACKRALAVTDLKSVSTVVG